MVPALKTETVCFRDWQFEHEARKMEVLDRSSPFVKVCV